MSPSDLKQVKQPLWIEPGRGNPTLMLFSAVDDRSGVVYQEYRCVYGEDAESALRFFFNAMAAKPEDDMPFQGIPEAIYMDNGPVTRSRVFQNVMACLGVRIMTHIPAGKDGKRVTARSKGKVERPFRTIKELHETLYHFHEPQNEAEANLWLRRYLLRYNAQVHRSEPHSRIEDWVRNLPELTAASGKCALGTALRLRARTGAPQGRHRRQSERRWNCLRSPRRSRRRGSPCSGGACSTRSSTSNMATSGSGRSARPAVRFRCISTGNFRSQNLRNALIASPNWRRGSGCRGPRSMAANCPRLLWRSLPRESASRTPIHSRPWSIRP